MKKTVVAWIVALTLCLSACTLAETTVQDRAGNLITVPETVDSIISLAPAITRVLLDLGMTDKLVAADTYSAQAMDLPEDLLLFDMMAPDIEQIVALSPDLVLVSSMTLVEGKDVFTSFSEMGIHVAFIPSSNSIDAIIEDVQFIGALVGKADEAASLCEPLQAAIQKYRVETENPVSVYFEVGSSPALYSFGSDTFLNEIIELLGGRNIFADKSGWLSISEESIIAAAPDIIFTNERWIENATDVILERPGWENIPAIKNGNVYFIDDDASSQPSHMIVYALEAMAEAFPKP